MAASLHVLSASAIEVDEPTNFSVVQQNVNRVRGDIAGAQCGGWMFDERVEGKISTVTGAPGRKGTVFDGGKLIPEVAKSGLAKREEKIGALEDGFVFPSSGLATGWSTVCHVNECGNSYPYIRECPGEPPCRNPDECREMCSELNAWQRVHQSCTAEWTEYDWDGNPFQVFDFLEDTSPCKNVDNGDWCQPGDENWVDPRTRLQDAHPDANVWCDIDEMLYCCSNAVVANRENDPERNCLNCNGDGLEDRNNPGVDFNGEVPADLEQTGCRKGKNAPNGREYVSIYRRFMVSFTRNAVPVVPRDDTQRTDVPVDCYCRYEEFDPKTRKTLANDHRCIVMLEEEEKRFRDMKETQHGKGEYGQNSNLPDPTYEENRTRDTLKDLWVNNFSDTFSLLNGNKIKESPKDNLFPLLQLDNTNLVPTAQLDKTRVFSSGSLLRATDDTVNTDHTGRRTIVEWWQEQETQAHKLFTPPILRLILPTPASEGLNLTDPLLTPKGNSRPPGSLRINQQIIDLQIRADPEDLLSEVSAYLENALLIHVQEEPVTLVVPLASPVELRALAQGWKRWGEEQGEGEAKSKAEGAAQKLEAYAERIDQVRALRSELAQYIGRLLTYQGTMTRAIGEWLEGNLGAWDRYATAWRERLNLQPQWKEIQQKYRVFHDRTNMPWCRNDRYTTPIYSFLDPWMPGPDAPRDLALNIDENPANDTDPYKLPRLAIDPLPDLVYDFTVFRVSTGTVLLPVLHPLQVRLQQSLLNPPAFYKELGAVSEQLDKLNALPDLPPVPTIFQEVLDRLLPNEVLHTSSPTTIQPTLPELPPEIREVLEQISRILTGMDRTYGEFWESIVEYPERDIPEKKWDCQGLGVMPCVHVEMDLLERFTRIGSRPAVQLKEDFASHGLLRTGVINNKATADSLPSSRLSPPTAVPPCPREDWVCQVFNAEKTYAREGWRIEGVKEGTGKEDLQNLRERLRKETIPNSSSSFPYIVYPEGLLPSFNVPGPFILPAYPSGRSGSASS